jgi:hypothetical protein
MHACLCTTSNNYLIIKVVLLHSTSLPTLANTSDYSILEIASKVGIDLGSTLDMIDATLALIREQEQDRVNIF